VKAIAAIVESQHDVDASAERVIAALLAERDASKAVDKHEHLAANAREVAKQRRLEVGRELNAIRPTWAPSGPKAKGWSEYLSRVKLDDSTAVRYMREAKNADAPDSAHKSEAEPNPGDIADDDHGQYGPRIVPDPDRPRETPQFRAMTADDVIQAMARLPAEDRKRVLREAKANVNGGSGEVSRGTWCTPKAIAVAVGPWDLDPFSNPRSHVMAVHRCQLEDSGDGFGDGSGPGSYRVANRDAEYAGPETRVWIQPDYQMVDDAIAHYEHTRFCALLRWSPDVKGWFARLWPRVAVVAFPRGERVAFEPPPGIEDKGAGSPHSHALYYADERDVTDEVRAMCIVWRVDHTSDPATVTPIDEPPNAA